MTRTRRLRRTSIYLVDSTCAHADGVLMAVLTSPERELRTTGRVPFVVGGEWNCCPDNGRCWWTGPGRLIRPLGSTTRFGKTFDLFVVGAVMAVASAVASPDWAAADHRGVTLEATGWQGNALGRRQTPARGVDLTREARDATWDTEAVDMRQGYAGSSRAADDWLVAADGEPGPTGAVRGHKPRYVDNALGAPQGLEFDAADAPARGLAMRVRRARRLARVREAPRTARRGCGWRPWRRRTWRAWDSWSWKPRPPARKPRPEGPRGGKIGPETTRGERLCTARRSGPRWRWRKKPYTGGDPQATLYIPDRVERTTKAWAALWGTGKDGARFEPGRCRPITSQDIRRVLRRAKDKAAGPVLWQMSELRALPPPSSTWGSPGCTTRRKRKDNGRRIEAGDRGAPPQRRSYT